MVTAGRREHTAGGPRSDSNVEIKCRCVFEGVLNVREIFASCCVYNRSPSDVHVCFVSPALCVRFITKRYIGEYDHKKGKTHHCSKHCLHVKTYWTVRPTSFTDGCIK